MQASSMSTLATTTAPIRVRKSVKKDGTVAVYKYESIKGTPIKEYFKSKSKLYYKPQNKKRDPKIVQLILDLHAQKIQQIKIAQILGVSVYIVRSVIRDHQTST